MNLYQMAAYEQRRAWQDFVSYAIPNRMTSRAAMSLTGTMPKGKASAHSSEASALRRVRNGGVACPSAEKVWGVAAATRTLPERFWCAGPVFLFAAAHFDWFALVIIEADEVYLPTSRKAALVASAADAVDYRESTINEALEIIRDSSVSDTVKQRSIRRLMASGSRSLIAARRAWELSEDEEAAFNDVFLRHSGHTCAATFSKHRSVGVVTAWLARRHPEIGLRVQRRIVATSLWRELAP